MKTKVLTKNKLEEQTFIDFSLSVMDLLNTIKEQSRIGWNIYFTSFNDEKLGKISSLRVSLSQYENQGDRKEIFSKNIMQYENNDILKLKRLISKENKCIENKNIKLKKDFFKIAYSLIKHSKYNESTSLHVNILYSALKKVESLQMYIIDTDKEESILEGNFFSFEGTREAVKLKQKAKNRYLKYKNVKK